MKKLTVFFSLIMLIILISLLSQIKFVPEIKTIAALGQPGSCGSIRCKQLEADILRSTVRVQLQVWRAKPDESGYDLDESVGHATLRDGRSLVTHNHYALLEQAGLPSSSISVVIYDSNGRYLLSSPLTDYNISLEADETLVFDMKYDYGRDQLAAAGITSANFENWRSLKLQPGMEVAQVDWDGRVTRVDWTLIKELIVDEGVPRLILSDGVTGGGSGAGIFWNGIHIANNWQSIEHIDDAGSIIQVTSVASLNDYQ